MLSPLSAYAPYAVLGAAALLGLFRLLNIGKREKGLPPGPPTVPVLGNMHIFPTTSPYYKFTEWARIYGPVYSLKIASGTAIVLTGAEVVRELMDRRAATTLDRPPNFIFDQVTNGKNMVLARCTDDWRTLRRAVHSILTPQSCAEHVRTQTAESSQTLHDILHDPDRFYTHLRRNSCSTIMSVLYGRRAPRFETQEVTKFYHVQDLWGDVLEPGAHPPLDIIPILRRVPERWAPWKPLCREIRRLQRKLYFGLLADCENRVQTGTQTGCFMEQVVERQEELGLSHELAGYLGAVLLEGGADSTASYLQTLVLAMIAYPDTQRKAHEELDRVVGQERAPTLDDLPDLPYVQAIIKELHRWRPVAPLSVPHAPISDETYMGYLIPKGATIFVNNWGIFHDEDLFENAEAFEPQRFVQHEHGVREGVDSKGLRQNMVFGYGRRTCPGMHLAKNSININVARLIWAFNFGPKLDLTTGDSDIDIWKFTKGLLVSPEPFGANITPRSEQIANIIDDEFAAASSDFERYEDLLSSEGKSFVHNVRGVQ